MNIDLLIYSIQEYILFSPPTFFFFAAHVNIPCKLLSQYLCPTPFFSVFAIFDAVICFAVVAIAIAVVAVKPPLLTPASTQLAHTSRRLPKDFCTLAVSHIQFRS